MQITSDSPKAFDQFCREHAEKRLLGLYREARSWDGKFGRPFDLGKMYEALRQIEKLEAELASFEASIAPLATERLQ
jgi:hypothetical protein